MRDALQRRLLVLGDELLPVRALGLLRVDLEDALPRRALVGDDVEAVLPGVDAVLGALALHEQRAKSLSSRALPVDVVLAPAARMT